MIRATALLLGIAAFSMTPSAEARDGCGGGWYFNGRTCVPMNAQPYRYNDPPIYAPQRYYYRDYNNRPPRPIMGANGTVSCGNPNYTYQDGACKPYIGR